jgi:hypothetical protein
MLFEGANEIIRATPTCLGECFWGNIFKKNFTKIFKKIS